jgi:hypothetical protein
MYDVNYTDVRDRDIQVADPDWPTKSCDNGWEFNYTVIPYSTVATEVIIPSHSTHISFSMIYL